MSPREKENMKKVLITLHRLFTSRSGVEVEKAAEKVVEAMSELHEKKRNDRLSSP
jgi:hypothetical protein